MKDWSYFDKFEAVTDRYLPAMGEGDTLATQIVTAVSKLVYKWYNDGDVFDNRFGLDGWCNDLSSYANWLHEYSGGDVGADIILERIFNCRNASDYEDLLADLADELLDERWLELMAMTSKVGSIYNCDGPFEFVEYDDDDEEWYEEEY